MRPLLLTLGTRGDVEPVLALAAGLRRAGHDAAVAAATRFAPMLAAQGVPHHPLGDGFLSLIGGDAARDTLDGRGALPRRLMTVVRLARQAGPLQVQVQREAWAAVQAHRPDLLLHHPKLVGAVDLAGLAGLPAVVMALAPMLVPTAAFSCPGLPDAPPGPWRGAGRRAGYRLFDRLSTRIGGGPVQRWRAEGSFGPRPPGIGLRHDAQGRPLPVLHAHSAALCPRPDDWPAEAVVTGAWTLPGPADWTPPPTLRRFLEAGPPPVYIGFGSMAGGRPQRLRDVVTAAVRRAGVRAVLARGWGGLGTRAGDEAASLGLDPATVHLIDEAPHDRLFPLMAAVVHHGGAGTTHAGLRAGRPTVVCPFFGDQPFWGRRVHEAGAGPAPMPQRRLRVDRLATVLRQAVEDPAWRLAAENLGRQMRAEDGVGQAIRWLEAAAATGGASSACAASQATPGAPSP